MKLFIVILLMSLVTYLPRSLPLLVLGDRPMPPRLKALLTYIPYAALGALIFPGVILAIPGRPAAVVAGMCAAVAVSWFRGGLVLAVVASIAASYGTILIAG
jgi:branched-subunit amino acid transport protein